MIPYQYLNRYFTGYIQLQKRRDNYYCFIKKYYFMRNRTTPVLFFRTGQARGYHIVMIIESVTLS